MLMTLHEGMRLVNSDTVRVWASRLACHHYLPLWVHHVVAMDTDTLIVADLDGLFSHFRNFRPNQVRRISKEGNRRTLHTSSCAHQPAYLTTNVVRDTPVDSSAGWCSYVNEPLKRWAHGTLLLNRKQLELLISLATPVLNWFQRL